MTHGIERVAELDFRRHIGVTYIVTEEVWCHKAIILINVIIRASNTNVMKTLTVSNFDPCLYYWLCVHELVYQSAKLSVCLQIFKSQIGILITKPWSKMCCYVLLQKLYTKELASFAVVETNKAHIVYRGLFEHPYICCVSVPIGRFEIASVWKKWVCCVCCVSI